MSNVFNPERDDYEMIGHWADVKKERYGLEYDETSELLERMDKLEAKLDKVLKSYYMRGMAAR